MSNADNDNSRIKRIIIKPYNLKELAEIYGLTLYRMRRALKPHLAHLGKRDGYFFATKQVTKIFKFVKLPSNVKVVSA